MDKGKKVSVKTSSHYLWHPGSSHKQIEDNTGCMILINTSGHPITSSIVLCKRGRADLPGMIEAETQIYLDYNPEKDKKGTISHFFFFCRLKSDYWREVVLPGLNQREKTVNTLLPRVIHLNIKEKKHNNKERNGFLATKKWGGSAIRLFSNGTQIDRVLRLQEET